MKKNKKRKSFVKFCIVYFTIYAIVLFVLFIFINSIISVRIQEQSSTLDDLLVYNDYLKNDNYENIPLKKFRSNDIMVFDENNRLIFSTKNHKDLSINNDELDYIVNYNDNYYYYVQEFYDKNNELNYVIYKNRYDQKNGYDEIKDYVILDKDLNIKEGTLFKDKNSLTQREFDLLLGAVGNKSYIEKYEYITVDNEKRTLIFFDYILNENAYISRTARIYSIWLVLIPTIIVFELLITFLFYKKIKKMMNSMQNVMDNYESVQINPKNNNEVPREFTKFYYSFNSLLFNLNKEKEERLKEQIARQNVITNLSHDLKTPLTVIGGYAKAFKDGVVPKDKEKKYLDAIYEKSLLASNIIDSLFEYSKMNHFEFKPTFEEHDFTEFCKEYLASKYSDLELQGYNLELDLIDDKIDYVFDSNLMTRLFDNIINNSVKHNKKNTTIYFDYKYENGYICITLADNGIGLNNNEPEALFNPFVIGSESRTGGKGTGLGLYIAKRVVELHNGQIEINKKPISPHKFEININLKRQ